MCETQSLTLAQLDNLVSTNEISTHSGKRTQDPKGPEWYEREQEQRRIESQSQTQENRELLFGEEEPEEQVHQGTQRDEAEVEKEVDSDAETTDGNNNEEETPEAEEEEEPMMEKSKQPPDATKRLVVQHRKTKRKVTRRRKIKVKLRKLFPILRL